MLTDRPRRVARVVALWLIGALLVGVAACGAGAPVPSVGLASAPGSAPPADVDCGTSNLISPGGEPVDLTGTWEGGIFLHHVRQIGDCVWWIGYGRWPGTELGELATLTYYGRLATDFTLTGAWTTIVEPGASSVYWPGPVSGSVAFLIGFDPDNGTATTLTRVGAGRTDAEYPSDELRFVGPLPESANPPQQ